MALYGAGIKKNAFTVKKRTSIGGGSRTNPQRTQPKNKHKRRSWKAYRGQG